MYCQLCHLFQYQLRMYKAKSVLDKRIDQQSNRELFLVQWQNMGRLKQTWQPLQELNKNYYDLLANFQEKFGHLKTTSIGKVYIPPSKQIYHEFSFKTKRNKKNEHSLKMPVYAQEKSEQKQRSCFDNFEVEIDLEAMNMDLPPNYNMNLNKFQGNQSTRRKTEEQKEKKSQIESPPQVEDHHKPLFSNPNTHLHQENRNSQQSQSFEPIESNQPSGSPLISEGYVNRQENSEEQQNNIQNIQKVQELRWPEQEIYKLKMKKNNRKTQQEHDRAIIQIKGIKRSGDEILFFAERQDIKGWFPHKYMFQKYPRELCLFYERNLEFF